MDKAIAHSSLTALVEKATAAFERIPYSAIALAARIFPAAVFWKSGQTKLDGWLVCDNAVYLFREEYRLPPIDPVIAAHSFRRVQSFELGEPEAAENPADGR